LCLEVGLAFFAKPTPYHRHGTLRVTQCRQDLILAASVEEIAAAAEQQY